MSRYFCLLLLFLTLLRPLQAENGWTPTITPMSDSRWASAYCLLSGGTAGLVGGGYSFPTDRCVATADLFNPRTRRFARCRGRLVVPRNFAQAALLPDGTALISGGYNTVLGTLDSAELFDPVTQNFSLLPSHLSSPRELFTSTTLTDGQVLIVGGFNTHRGRTQRTADIYDPAARTFTPTGMLSKDRFGQDAVRLADGRVLIVGGTHWFVGQPAVKLASAEIYDPAAGRFHPTHAPMNFARDRPTATLLADGHVLIAGGQNDEGEPEQAELFDPSTETFTLVPGKMIAPRMAHTAALLPDGRVLLAGGWSVSLQSTTGSVEIYDPAARDFSPVPALPEGAHDQALLVFPSGLVLVAGGKQVKGGRETSLATGYTRQFSPRQNSHQ